ncbi:MAG: methanogenesis marker 5 protein [Methanosarcinaceae archaeon]|nr:methanogenesis marker 5 protein [Methanosarcinaceae archaeon]MDD4332213.1 methanogenesis marker 5 protein [Methanosarcinaceae archaeon]MDD4749035.1 methanogenesis marker 5 protein [Methanosarcinaceae archaeon]
MLKVFIYPVNSLILADLVERFGHKPLVVMNQVREKVTNISLDSPPVNITPEDPKIGLRFAAVEVPAGVRGRMSLIGPLIEEAEAAIIVENPPVNFGCVGCNRTNELMKYLVRSKEIPILEVKYPESNFEAREFVYNISVFLENLSKASGEKKLDPQSGNAEEFKGEAAEEKKGKVKLEKKNDSLREEIP